MKLLLTSSGITNKSIENALLELLDKPFNKANLVFIPTAANVEEDISGWLENDINNFKKLEFLSFEVIDIAKILKNIWLPIFEKSDVLVFGGGNTKYLYEQISDSGLKELLPGFLKNKVYVGISAGSMVTARNINFSSDSILYYEKTGKLENIKGLGFIDFEIRPHLNSKWFPKVRLDYLKKLAKKIPNTFYAIDDNTAVKIINGKISVVSKGAWKKFN